MNGGLRERLAEVLSCTPRCYPATRVGGAHSEGCRLNRLAQVEGLLPVVEREIAAARGEALRAAADGIERSSRTCKVKRTCHEADIILLHARADVADRAADRAALSPDPGRGEAQLVPHSAVECTCGFPDHKVTDPGQSAEGEAPTGLTRIDLSRIGYGICPRCRQDRFIGHGPLCWECYSDSSDGEASGL